MKQRMPKLSIRQWMQKSLFDTADARYTLSNIKGGDTLYSKGDDGNTISDNGCRILSVRRSHSIRQQMQKTLYQTAKAGDTLSERGSGDTLSYNGCRTLYL